MLNANCSLNEWVCINHVLFWDSCLVYESNTKITAKYSTSSNLGITLFEQVYKFTGKEIKEYCVFWLI